ncbi:hypothetical protein EVAR_34806_1 [Eumeta japonica]|uniref:Uncharacterized protein n=1 Tax=Eumeta variegata TaxID=151549 RepID=A0A4C1WB91_EUMVA|nr:hypothetical protein EVAR_34806_1 [Eumeta japonica]
MSNQMPIYSHVVSKSQYRPKGNAKSAAKSDKQQAAREFDPLNFNNGGNFVTNAPQEQRHEKTGDRRESKRSGEKGRRGQSSKIEASEGKVEAYLRQNQVSIRQQQHRHSAVRQAEHRVNLR